jgi:prolyl-tRNA synthetase
LFAPAIMFRRPLSARSASILSFFTPIGPSEPAFAPNKDDYHLKNVTPGEDFAPEYFDLRQVAKGDACSRCGGPLDMVKAVELGHIFKLGYRYSNSMNLRVLGEDGKEIAPIMGSYGIGIERILTCAIELFHDEDGMALPAPIAPFTVVITPVNFSEETQREAALKLYDQCVEAGIDALLDDRDERPGVKFKDADLIGIPYRITLGKKLTEGKVEFIERTGKKSTDVAVDDAVRTLKCRLAKCSSVS